MKTALTFIAHVSLIAGVQKAGLDVHVISRATASADVLGYAVSPANSHCSRMGKRISCIRSVARTVSWRRRIGGRQWSRVCLGAQQSWALSILDASFKFARAVSGEPWSSVRMELREFEGSQCLLRSDWSLRWLDVCTCTDASEKCVAFAVREGCRELASAVGRVSEWTKFKRSSRTTPCQVACGRSIAPDVSLEWSSSDENEVSLAR